MASSVTSTLLTILSLLFIAATLTTVSARPGLPFHPCNTLIVSTYSFSLRPRNPISIPNSNPNPNPEFFIISAELHPFRHRRFLPLMVNRFDENPNLRPHHLHHHEHEPSLLGFSSLRDRTKDILSVVASLLFGAACGALTAGTMYLIWSLFNPRHESYNSIDEFSSDDDDDDHDHHNNVNDDDDIFNPKKEGYVAIPVSAPPAKVVDSIPTVAPPSAGGSPAAA